MVLYFSATGNTQFIAKELAKRLDDECVNLLSKIKAQDYTPVHSEKPFIVELTACVVASSTFL